MRGQSVFNEILKQDKLNGTARKGRSNSLVTWRNECLIARYYYHGYCKNKCYEETIRLLVAEFFLSPSTIAQLVLNNSEQVQYLKQRSPAMHYFNSHWPHLKWS